MDNNNNNEIIAKFQFNLEQETCSWYQNQQWQEIPKEHSGHGTLLNQKFFILEKETNPSHWINYTITFARGKVWLASWYKQATTTPIKYYKIKVEKTSSLMEISFTSEDEVIKVFQEDKNKDKWISIKDLKKK